MTDTLKKWDKMIYYTINCLTSNFYLKKIVVINNLKYKKTDRLVKIY